MLSDVFVWYRLEDGELRGYVLPEPNAEPIACLWDVPTHLSVKGSVLHIKELAKTLNFEFFAFPEVDGMYYIPPVAEAEEF